MVNFGILLTLTHLMAITIDLVFWGVKVNTYNLGGLGTRDHMVVGFTTTCAISAYHH